jgi:hypothetical protein
MKPRTNEKNKSNITEISRTPSILESEFNSGRRKIKTYNPIFTLYMVRIKIMIFKEYIR